MHPLATYLAERRISFATFAERIGVANASVVQRYTKGRVPRDKDVMAAIVRETEGAIQPNDFYPVAAE